MIEYEKITTVEPFHEKELQKCCEELRTQQLRLRHVTAHMLGKGNSIVHGAPYARNLHNLKSKSLPPPPSLPTGRHRNFDATDRNLRPAVTRRKV